MGLSAVERRLPAVRAQRRRRQPDRREGAREISARFAKAAGFSKNQKQGVRMQAIFEKP
jgi:hypothetical protein